MSLKSVYPTSFSYRGKSSDVVDRKGSLQRRDLLSHSSLYFAMSNRISMHINITDELGDEFSSPPLFQFSCSFDLPVDDFRTGEIQLKTLSSDPLNII